MSKFLVAVALSLFGCTSFALDYSDEWETSEECEERVEFGDYKHGIHNGSWCDTNRIQLNLNYPKPKAIEIPEISQETINITVTLERTYSTTESGLIHLGTINPVSIREFLVTFKARNIDQAIRLTTFYWDATYPQPDKPKVYKIAFIRFGEVESQKVFDRPSYESPIIKVVSKGAPITKNQCDNRSTWGGTVNGQKGANVRVLLDGMTQDEFNHIFGFDLRGAPPQNCGSWPFTLVINEGNRGQISFMDKQQCNSTCSKSE